MAENTKPRFFHGYIIVAATFFITMITYGTMYTFGVFFEPLLAEFGWTRAMTSGAYSLFMVFSGLLYIVTGRLNDRFGPRIVVTVCGFFLGLGYLLMSQISAVWHLYLFYGVIISIGVSGAFVPLISTVARWFVKKRGLMTGIVEAGTGIGTVIMPPVANWLIFNYGWRTSYIIVGIIVLLPIVLAAQFLKRHPEQIELLPYGADEATGENLNLQARGFSLQQAVHTRQFWLLCGIYFSFLFCVQTIMVHAVIYATGLGISPTSAASILVIIGGLSIAGRVMIGSAGDRIGNKPALTISLALMSLTLFGLVATKGIWALYLFAAIFGFIYGGLVVLISPLVAELFGLRSHGVILGIVAFCSGIGGAIGPVMAGHIFDITGSYQLAFLVCGAIGFVSSILTLLLRPANRKGLIQNI